MSGTKRPPLERIFLESRYRKLERGLPQTIFFCPECKGHRRRSKNCERCSGFGKLTKDSVQELIARRMLPAFKARYGKFHGAGREDVDVLMLGRGRPFVYEVVGARNPEAELASIEERIAHSCAGRIELDPFRSVAKQRVAELKESHFDKIYRARVGTEASVDAGRLESMVGRSLDITQRTPSRVAHRRADLLRERNVRILEARDVAADGFTIDVRCVHGTYVKEWVSGDEGRTTGSLSELLETPCGCEQLDVLEILTGEDCPDPG